MSNQMIEHTVKIVKEDSLRVVIVYKDGVPVSINSGRFFDLPTKVRRLVEAVDEIVEGET